MTKRHEAVMAVERPSDVVLRIHHQRKNTHACVHGPLHGVPQQSRAELAFLKMHTHCKTTETRHRHVGVARQFFGQCVRQIRQRHTTRSQCVVAGNDLGVDVDGDVADADAPAHVLRGLLFQIPIEGVAAGQKG